MNQIELIAPNGSIRFVDVDPGANLINIGRHTDNHIVVDSASVEPFHAMLDLRRTPFQLVNFAENGLTLNGIAVERNEPAETELYDRIELGGYTLLVVANDSVRVPSASPQGMAVPPASAMPMQRPPAAAPGSLPPGMRPQPAMLGRAVNVAPDQLSEMIGLEINERSATVDPEQMGIYNLTVINGGPLVAGFDVYVDGLPAEWVTVSDAQFNLNEGRRHTFTVSVAAPRGIEHRAGAYPFNIIVASPNYPGHIASRNAVFTLNPFYEFEMSELDPRSLTVKFPKARHTAVTVVELSNSSNTDLAVRLDGADDERGCLFEFETAENTSRRSKQVELRLKPGTAQTVVTRITPNERSVYRVRAKNYPFTLTANPQGAGILPQSASGNLYSRPLFGPGSLFLFLASLVLLALYLFRPQVYTLTVDRGRAIAGESVVLTWQASPFTNLRIEPDIGDVGTGNGSKEFKPLDTKVYKLVGENILSRILPFLAAPPRDVAIAVEPVRPSIVQFDAQNKQLLTGDSATVFWDVRDATELTILTNGAPETIAPDQIAKGQRKVQLLLDTRFELSAKNRYGTVNSNFVVRVVNPTGTPIPPPVITRFDVKPSVITAGQEVLIEWEVAGADRVTISPLVGGADGFPPKGSIAQKPDANVAYVLTAFNGPIEVKRQQNVNVGPAPTATPVPIAPRIEFFRASPDEVVAGSAPSRDVKLTWSIVGDTKGVEISGPDIGRISALSKTGSISIAVTKSTLVVLTANGEKDSASQVTNVRVIEPTATPTNTPTPTPAPTGTPVPPTATPFPLPVIESFSASSGENPPNANEVQQLISNDLPANTFRYEVLAGAKVKLAWKVNGADETKLNDGGVPATGEFVVTATTDGQSQKISATSKGGKVDRFVVFKLRDRPIPPPPTNFAGPVSKAPPLKFTWSYPVAQLDNIVGFRMYRAPTQNAPFVRIADETVLGRNAVSFDDGTPAPTCGRAYYVVAVYLKVDQSKVETPPSAQSWYAGACP